MIKRLLIIVGLLLSLVTSWYILYQLAATAGEAGGYRQGYSAGYTVGQAAGYGSGQEDGYKLGYEEGEQTGRDEGYSAGQSQGYEAGISAGLGHGYTLRAPTYDEVLLFLAEDKTNEREYSDQNYVCSHFSRDVCNNAEAAGLRSAFVEIRYPEMGHSIVAFDTVDKGIVFFEPQHDDEVKPVVGKRFYRCVEPKPGHFYEVPPYDDTIKDILIIW